MIALERGKREMLEFFWEELGYLWNEDTFESLFKLMARKDYSEYITFLFSSRTLHELFASMSFSYRFCFLEHILEAKADLLSELSQFGLAAWVGRTASSSSIAAPA